MSKNPRRAMPPSKQRASEAPPPDLTPRALTKQEFGRRLYDLMVRNNMNQAGLARASGLGRDSISRYIAGVSFPEPDSLGALAKVFGREPHELLPNAVMQAIDHELAALEIREAAGHPDKVWVRVNQMVGLKTAAIIMDAIKTGREAAQK